MFNKQKWWLGRRRGTTVYR